MLVTLAGIVTLFNWLLLKADPPILVRLRSRNNERCALGAVSDPSERRGVSVRRARPYLPHQVKPGGLVRNVVPLVSGAVVVIPNEDDQQATDTTGNAAAGMQGCDDRNDVDKDLCCGQRRDR